MCLKVVKYILNKICTIACSAVAKNTSVTIG